MTLTPTAHRATRDEVLATRTGSLASYWTTADNGVQWATLGPVPGDPDRFYARGIAGSASAGLVLLVTRTGSADVRGKGAQVRVRIDFPRDTGDAAGTLAFDADSIGGVAPRVLFG
jgi:hypothetical protein